MIFQPSSLVGLGPLAKWRWLLKTLYGVSDLRVAHAYLKRAESLSLDLEQGLIAGLGIAPVLGPKVASGDVSARHIARIARKLGLSEAQLGLMNGFAGHHPGFPEDTDEPESLAVHAGRTISPIDFSRYFQRSSKDRDEQMMGRVGTLEGRHVILVRSQDLGVLAGPGITFNGVPKGRGEYEFHPGWVLYGPKRDFEPGEYELEIDLEGPSDGRLVFDVAAHGGMKKIIELKLAGSAKVRFSYEIQQHDRGIEFRIANVQDKVQTYRVNSILFQRVKS